MQRTLRIESVCYQQLDQQHQLIVCCSKTSHHVDTGRQKIESQRKRYLTDRDLEKRGCIKCALNDKEEQLLLYI